MKSTPGGAPLDHFKAWVINLKQRNQITGLYLKLISNMTSTFSQHGLVEKVLEHLKILKLIK